MNHRGFQFSGIGPRAKYDSPKQAHLPTLTSASSSTFQSPRESTSSLFADQNPMLNESFESQDHSLLDKLDVQSSIAATKTADMISSFNAAGNIGDSLGGTTRSNAMLFASVPVPIPILAKNSMRAFAFVNASSLGQGQIFPWITSQLANPSSNSMKTSCCSAKNASSTLTNQPFFGYLRASYGFGYSIAFANSIRLEATYAIPLLQAKHDGKKAFQFGVGLTIN